MFKIFGVDFLKTRNFGNAQLCLKATIYCGLIKSLNSKEIRCPKTFAPRMIILPMHSGNIKVPSIYEM